MSISFRPLCYLATIGAICCFLSARAEAGTTVLEFDDAGINNNDVIPLDYASAASANTSGIAVTDGGTPDIDVFWEGLGDAWDYHTSNVWAALDSSGNVNIAQLDWHIELSIEFVTNGADTVFQLGKFDLGNATDQVENAYGWELSLRDLSTDEVVVTQMSADLGPGGTDSVVFDFTGEPGTDYRLEFVPNASDFPDDGNGNQFVFRTAIDALEFSQNPVVNVADPDLNMDGFVDGLDLGILLGAWDPAVAAAMGITRGTAVPEPSSMLMLAGLAAIGLYVRRGRYVD